MNRDFLRSPKLLKTIVGATLLFPIALLAIKSDELTPIPTTSNEVAKYIEHSQEKIQHTLSKLASTPRESQTPETMLRPWNRLANDLITDFGMLTFVAGTDLPSKASAQQAIQDHQSFLSKSLIQNPELFRSILNYAEKAIGSEQPLSPYQNYEISCLLNSCEGVKDSLTQAEQVKFRMLLDQNAKQEKKPFIYLKSQTPEKMASAEEVKSGLTILTLNTCFVPGDFPYIFGGVFLPWQKRVQTLGDKILSADADVVCLQEVHAEDASYALYEKLKGRYTHFYAAIGPRFLGFSLSTLGLPSGLFVASKYAIEKPEFTLFKAAGFPMNYGFFDFILKNGDEPVAHIFTTHLQSLNYLHFPEIRASQLTQLLERMETEFNAQKQEIPFFLCGDLNIPLGSDEPGEAIIKKYFHDDYNKNQGHISEANGTCTDYFTNYLLASRGAIKEITPNFEILDYALLLKSLPLCNKENVCHQYEISTSILQMHEISRPEHAISDHNGLVTRVNPKSL
ncbi:MAG: endonuclease/exonuclease/phosphatase family protein [Chlamydiales bacterium]|nr:endonuclease/exonuclease/phosphatase family protein [Chlamydiales bacterium]